MVGYQEVNRTSTLASTSIGEHVSNPFSIDDESLEESDTENNRILFKDFSEPELLKTGYLIPLSCGHNGNYSEDERTILEIHLTQAGFINN